MAALSLKIEGVARLPWVASVRGRGAARPMRTKPAPRGDTRAAERDVRPVRTRRGSNLRPVRTEGGGGAVVFVFVTGFCD